MLPTRRRSRRAWLSSVERGIGIVALVLVLASGPDSVAASIAVVEGPLPTQDPSLRWQSYRRYATREGVPRNWVTALAQDREGFVYAGTEEGLARYDGRHWNDVPFPAAASARPPYVTALASTADGTVWVGTDTAGLYAYRDGRLERRALASASSGVTCVEADADAVWVGTEAGVERCDADACRALGAARGMHVRSLLRTREADTASLYVGTRDSGVLRIDGVDAAPRLASWRLASADGLPDDAVAALAEWGGANGRDLGVATTAGVARLSGATLVVYAGASGFPGGANGFVRLPGVGGGRRLVATLATAGLAEFDDDGRWRRTTTANGLPENAINTALVTDADQPVLWLGSGHSGVLRGEPQMWSAFVERDGLPNRVVVGLGETRFLDGEQAVWIGTGGGSVRRDGDGWRPWLPPRYARSEVFDVVRDGDHLWVATREGLLRVARDGVRAYTSANSALPDDAVVDLHLLHGDDGADTLWLGTRRGIARVSGDHMEREHVPAAPPDFFVRALRDTRDADGTTRLWAASEHGLYHAHDGNWRRLGCAGETAVFDLRERGAPGREHALWVATFDGILRVDLDRGFACTRRALPEPASASSVYQLQFDASGRMYLFGAHGVLRLPGDDRGPADAGVERFDLADGLPDLEFTRASLVDAQGRLWGGTIEGVALYDPAAERPPAAPRPLRILSAREEGGGRVLDGDADLDEAAGNVAFELSLLAYQRDYRTRYRTQLVGLEAEPGEWNDRAHRSYSRLPPGHYEFRAWARAADGVESGPVSRAFRVHAPWWRRPWAVLLYAAAMILLGLCAGRLRARAFAARAHALEREVAERTRALAEANRRLAHASLTDPLTGLWNRRYFGLELPPECERAIRRAARGERSADLIFILADVDHFKRINDALGHAAGDAVLVEFARRVRALLRSGDVALRWGGEEFLVVLRDAERERAFASALRVRDAITATPFTVGAATVPVTCSIGWAAFPFDPCAPRRHSVDQVVTFADAALYRAKCGGRDRVVGARAQARVAEDIAFIDDESGAGAA
ncbi:diguanylate cyclase [Dokdonella sp.]|uniref:ligand-binding sensor domain-containing diguanylate cyclase n=1 Tax=Dokdonella sp. TaxID=2291710 RepID=UPI002F4252AF